MSTLLRSAALGGLVVLTACAHVGSSSGPTSQYFKGQGTVRLHSGDEIPGAGSWVKRTLDPAQSTITEEVVQLPVREGAKPREFLVTMTVSGSHFTMVETHGAFTGEGDLVGEAWHWSSWTSKAKLKDGSEVDSKDSIDASGLQSDKEIKGPDGTVMVTITDTLTPIDEAAFEAGRAQALSSGPPAATPVPSPPQPQG